MNVTISPRGIKILRALATGEALSRAAIEQAIGETRINTIRELGRLVEAGYVATAGEARATTYTMTDRARPAVLWDAEEYLAQEPDLRHARYSRIEPTLFGAVRGLIGKPSESVMEAVERRRQAGDSTTARKDLERFVIELSWKSSKIEGNTYTLLDTERLIREATEAPGHSHDEAVMILNHKRAFDYIWTHQDTFRSLTRPRVEEVHELLVKGLSVPKGLRKSGVGITGTVYVPPASAVEIASYLSDIIAATNELDEPAEKALACLVLLPYLQPFADGNKRTSRLVANAVLLAYGYPPLSYRSIDEQAYKGALILFYEQGSLANFRELYLKQLEDAARGYFFPID
jgi:Fic family protein